jgi:hypothetical protein
VKFGLLSLWLSRWGWAGRDCSGELGCGGLRWLCGVTEYGCEDHALISLLGVPGYDGVEVIRSGFNMVRWCGVRELGIE